MDALLPEAFDRYKEIWVVDTEFVAVDGERPTPVCLVAEELRSGMVHRLWHDAIDETPPYGLGRDVLFVAYNAVAELLVHRSLGWDDPIHILDLYVEFRRATNGLALVHGAGLLAALSHYGIANQSPFDKDVMRNLIIGGGPWSTDDEARILDYCQSDVTALKYLLFAMAYDIDLDRALLRGRYMRSVAIMEWSGIPMDVDGLENLLRQQDTIRAALIDDVNRGFCVFDQEHFSEDRFAYYLCVNDIAWPRHASGRLMLDSKTFDARADTYPQLKPLRDIRRTNAAMQNNKLCIGSDGRNRTSIRPFCSRTGRNQPSSSRFIFGQPAWWRGFIKPETGHGVAYLDWDQQEFGIAAALSGDHAMQAAYQSGDPYLAFAKQVGAAPPDATKVSHKDVRDQYKATVLAVQYGMGAHSLAERTKLSVIEAQSLLDTHRHTYHQFWSWSDAVLDTALWRGWIESVFGWRLNLPEHPNDRSVRNFPMQANGAEMLRLAIIMATDAGLELVAPVHDAVLIHAPLDRLSQDVAKMKGIMIEASSQVLAGFEIGAGVEICAYPDRFLDERGKAMWSKVEAYVT